MRTIKHCSKNKEFSINSDRFDYRIRYVNIDFIKIEMWFMHIMFIMHYMSMTGPCYSASKLIV